MTSEATAGQVPDIYGQVHPVETAELIDKQLSEFDALVVKRIQTKEDKELIEATVKCPELLTRDFKLMFLRCEVFNADLAVVRYAQYWKKRVEVFGSDKAFQPLTQDKALSEDSVALELGMMTIVLGATDSKGRAIVYMDPSVQDKSKYSRMSMARAIWYTVHSALESETAQKHGIIMLGDPSRAKFAQFDRTLMRTILSSLQGAIPMRLSVLHFCKPPAFASIILPIIKIFMSERTKKRLLIHSGSNEKVQKSLARYNLDKSVLPELLGGEVKLDVGSWLKERKSKGL